MGRLNTPLALGHVLLAEGRVWPWVVRECVADVISGDKEDSFIPFAPEGGPTEAAQWIGPGGDDAAGRVAVNRE